MKLSLYYPVKPANIIQGFGTNPDYYARFKDAYGQPERGHMGIDFEASHGAPVYAAHDGRAIYQVDDHGGDGFHLISDKQFDYKTDACYYKTIYWHMCSKDDPTFKPIVSADGNFHEVKAGDLLGYADNSGAPFESSGDHLHFGLVPCTHDGVGLELNNGFNGCIDATPFFNGLFAGDLRQVDPQTEQVIEEGLSFAKEALKYPSLWQIAFKLLQTLASFLH